MEKKLEKTIWGLGFGIHQTNIATVRGLGFRDIKMETTVYGLAIVIPPVMANQMEHRVETGILNGDCRD